MSWKKGDALWTTSNTDISASHQLKACLFSPQFPSCNTVVLYLMK